MALEHIHPDVVSFKENNRKVAAGAYYSHKPKTLASLLQEVVNINDSGAIGNAGGMKFYGEITPYIQIQSKAGFIMKNEQLYLVYLNSFRQTKVEEEYKDLQTTDPEYFLRQGDILLVMVEGPDRPAHEKIYKHLADLFPYCSPMRGADVWVKPDSAQMIMENGRKQTPKLLMQMHAMKQQANKNKGFPGQN